MYRKVLTRILVVAAVAAIGVSVGPIPLLAQQNSDLAPLLEEFLRKLPAEPGAETPNDSAPATDQATETDTEAALEAEPELEPESDGRVIPPPEERLATDPATPAVAPVILPPVSGPEADLARRLLAITDTEESQTEVRQNLAVDFVRRLRGRLDPQAAEVEAESTESAIVLAADQSGIPDGEELIFEVRIENRRFLQSLFGIKQGEGIFVDLAEAAELLEFFIEVNGADGTATGFFISPDKTFDLDLDAGEVTIEGETISVGAEDVRRLDDAILVHSDTFAIWFNVRLDVDFRDLAVNVVPETPIPLQQRFERQQRIAAFGADDVKSRSCRQLTIPTASSIGRLSMSDCSRLSRIRPVRSCAPRRTIRWSVGAISPLGPASFSLAATRTIRSTRQG